MRKPNLVLLVSAGVTAAAIGVSVTAAHASSAGPRPTAGGTGTWSVWIGESFGSFGGGSSPTVFSDPSTGGKISCRFGPGGAFARRIGMGFTHTLITITGQFYSQCTLPDGTSITLTPGTSPWTVTGRQFDPSRNLGVTTGRIHGVSVSFSSPSCSGVLDGTAAGANNGALTYEFYNNPHWLIIRNLGSTLHAYNVSGCSGIFNNGDAVTMHAILETLDLTISSP